MANILVVDDEVGIRELLSEILGDEGHVVTVAENAAAARGRRQAAEPRVVAEGTPVSRGAALRPPWPGGALRA